MPAARHAIVYIRAGCHLCDEACELLAQHGFSIAKIDIDGDSDLKSRYTTCVPVVEIEGKVRFRGRVNEVLLERLLSELR